MRTTGHPDYLNLQINIGYEPGGYQGYTNYTVTGPASEIDDWRDNSLFVNYHPCGYSTHERGRVDNKNGTVTAYFWRSNTCD